jgi:hypothetical protein
MLLAERKQDSITGPAADNTPTPGAPLLQGSGIPGGQSRYQALAERDDAGGAAGTRMAKPDFGSKPARGLIGGEGPKSRRLIGLPFGGVEREGLAEAEGQREGEAPGNGEKILNFSEVRGGTCR